MSPYNDESHLHLDEQHKAEAQRDRKRRTNRLSARKMRKQRKEEAEALRSEVAKLMDEKAALVARCAALEQRLADAEGSAMALGERLGRKQHHHSMPRPRGGEPQAPCEPQPRAPPARPAADWHPMEADMSDQLLNAIPLQEPSPLMSEDSGQSMLHLGQALQLQELAELQAQLSRANRPPSTGNCEIPLSILAAQRILPPEPYAPPRRNAACPHFDPPPPTPSPARLCTAPRPQPEALPPAAACELCPSQRGPPPPEMDRCQQPTDTAVADADDAFAACIAKVPHAPLPTPLFAMHARCGSGSPHTPAARPEPTPLHLAMRRVPFLGWSPGPGAEPPNTGPASEAWDHATVGAPAAMHSLGPGGALSEDGEALDLSPRALAALWTAFQGH